MRLNLVPQMPPLFITLLFYDILDNLPLACFALVLDEDAIDEITVSFSMLVMKHMTIDSFYIVGRSSREKA